ncbi:ROK family protein [Aliivibrio fischeri]|uniref:ROK family protein n=1 Tax=Aliivibrio fischeri TaxID=668 RepID=UPI0012D86700|nr:ROK family protein [Aliivibrio fischeri]MUK37657.1 ROK family protein [Aliivibrio fischeri]MUL07733.1 ROK family protein [Aliivibrio fischeri]
MLIGLDIGGTKIEGVLVNASTLTVEKRLRVPTPKRDYSDFISAVESVINKLINDNVKSIGIGCCGSVNKKTNLMQGANILYLNNKPFLSDIRHKFPMLPVEISNDANCLAISEFKTGAASEAESSCVAIIIGTGCGGGVILNNTIIEGSDGLGGEIGHNPLPHFKPEIDGKEVKCYCGSLNCNESFVSGTGFQRTFSEKYRPLSAKEIFEQAAKGDIDAKAHIELLTDQIARIIANLVNVINPEMIVLGGGLSNQDVIYPMIENKISNFTFNKKTNTRVLKAMHGDSSGVIGAAMLPLMK